MFLGTHSDIDLCTCRRKFKSYSDFVGMFLALLDKSSGCKSKIRFIVLNDSWGLFDGDLLK